MDSRARPSVSLLDHSELADDDFAHLAPEAPEAPEYTPFRRPETERPFGERPLTSAGYINMLTSRYESCITEQLSGSANMRRLDDPDTRCEAQNLAAEMAALDSEIRVRGRSVLNDEIVADPVVAKRLVDAFVAKTPLGKHKVLKPSDPVQRDPAGQRLFVALSSSEPQALRRLLDGPHCPYVHAMPLPVGDIWVFRGARPFWVLERKTLGDLEARHTDFKAQRAVMCQLLVGDPHFCQRDRLGLLVEYSDPHVISAVQPRALRTMLADTEHAWGIRVFHCPLMLSTVLWLVQAVRSIVRYDVSLDAGGEPWFDRMGPLATHALMERRRVRTDRLERMLRSLPQDPVRRMALQLRIGFDSVSDEMALAIARIYPTPARLTWDLRRERDYVRTHSGPWGRVPEWPDDKVREEGGGEEEQEGAATVATSEEDQDEDTESTGDEMDDTKDGPMDPQPAPRSKKGGSKPEAKERRGTKKPSKSRSTKYHCAVLETIYYQPLRPVDSAQMRLLSKVPGQSGRPGTGAVGKTGTKTSTKASDQSARRRGAKAKAGTGARTSTVAAVAAAAAAGAGMAAAAAASEDAVATHRDRSVSPELVDGGRSTTKHKTADSKADLEPWQLLADLPKTRWPRRGDVGPGSRAVGNKQALEMCKFYLQLYA